MKVRNWIILLFVAILGACQNPYRNGSSPKAAKRYDNVGVTGRFDGETFQVSADEYKQNFESRFGLLFLKTANSPFSGRILTVDTGENGEFVSTDESWKDGRKHGKSSKWFSNGVKMYERNYQRGKWHGTVTRWWPNGQKMYVRAYSFGARHGKEATWRSDGTPIILPSDGLPPAYSSSEDSEPLDRSLGDSPSSDDERKVVENAKSFNELKSDSSPPEEMPEFPSFDAPVEKPVSDASSADDFSPDLPLESPLGLETLPSENAEAEILGASPESAEQPALLPVADPAPEVDFGELPSLAEPSGSSDEGGLPPFPTDAGDDGLPPLPGEDDSFDGLPPLPPLP